MAYTCHVKQSQGLIQNNIWHLHSLSIDESQSNVLEIHLQPEGLGIAFFATGPGLGLTV